MKNVTLSIDENLLAAARRYAKRQNISLNQLIRDLLARTAAMDAKAAADEMLRVAERVRGDSKGWQWNRDEIHER
ncbi:MAG: DUF6364 family protein [Terriglobales bacterium]